MMLEQSRTGVATGRHLLAKALAQVAAARASKGSGLNFIHMEVLCLVQECPHQEGKIVLEPQKELVGLTEEAITKSIEYLIMMGHISRTPNCQRLIIVAETKN